MLKRMGVPQSKIAKYMGVESVKNLFTFMTVWDTRNKVFPNDSDTNQIRLPLADQANFNGSYNMIVDWGDGTTSLITEFTPETIGVRQHTYATPGVYTVKINGKCWGWFFDGQVGEQKDGMDNCKLMEIKRWGFTRYNTDDSGHYIFAHCDNLTITAEDVPNLDAISAGAISQFISYCPAITDFPGIEIWDTRGITSMNNVFTGCIAFNAELNRWNVSNVTSMYQMFNGCAGFNKSLTSWDTSKVTTMEAMFKDCTVFNGDITTFNTANVTDMSWMFYNAHAFNQAINGWNVGKVTNMSYMFCALSVIGTPNNFSQNLNSWDVSKVTDMSYMFQNCRFNENITSWVTSAVTTMSVMFSAMVDGGEPHEVLPFNQNISGWDTSNVTAMDYMFFGTQFNQNISGWDITKVTTMANMFGKNTSLSTANYDAILIGWATQAVQTGVHFNAGETTKYTGGGAAAAARAHLVDTHGWIITDGGAV